MADCVCCPREDSKTITLSFPADGDTAALMLAEGLVGRSLPLTFEGTILGWGELVAFEDGLLTMEVELEPDVTLKELLR